MHSLLSQYPCSLGEGKHLSVNAGVFTQKWVLKYSIKGEKIAFHLISYSCLAKRRDKLIADLSYLLHSSPIILFSIAFPSCNYILGLIFAIMAKWLWSTSKIMSEADCAEVCTTFRATIIIYIRGLLFCNIFKNNYNLDKSFSTAHCFGKK